MKKSQKIIVAAVVLVGLIGAGAYAFTVEEPASGILTKPDNSKLSKEQLAPSVISTNDPSATPATSAGRYTEYSEAAVADASYDTTVVFFFAPWCPECRAYKQAIAADEIPNGVQILELDFDSSSDLKKRYGVTLQTTFVRVNQAGELQKKWAGYGKEKSLSVLLENVQ